MDGEEEGVSEAETEVEEVEMDAHLGAENHAVDNVHQEPEVKDKDEVEVEIEHEVFSASEIYKNENEEDVEVICRK
jgi:hypothetical protein